MVTVLLLLTVFCFWRWHTKAERVKKAKLWAEIESEYVDLCARVERKHQCDIEGLKREFVYKSRGYAVAYNALLDKHRRQWLILATWRKRQFCNRYFHKDVPLMHL